MKLSVYDKLVRIYQEIHLKGNAPLDRLGIFEEWLTSPLRLRAFAVRVAGRAAGKKGKTNGVAGELGWRSTYGTTMIPPEAASW